MANPWTKKKPTLSLILSGVDAWAGAARGVLEGSPPPAGGCDGQGCQADGELLGIRPEAAFGGGRQQSQAPPLIVSAVLAGRCGSMDMLQIHHFADGGASIRCGSSVDVTLHLRECGTHEHLPFHGVHEVDGQPAAEGRQRLLEPARHPLRRVEAFPNPP